MPGARCTRSLVCKGRKHTSIRHRYTGSDPAFPAQWFYGLLRALPGDRAFLPPSPLRSLLLKDLNASVGASGPHDLMSSRFFGLLKTSEVPENKGFFRFLLDGRKACPNPRGPDRP